MAYAYGAQGAPVVGGGLGGLPRRAVASSTPAATAGLRALVTSNQWATPTHFAQGQYIQYLNPSMDFGNGRFAVTYNETSGSTASYVSVFQASSTSVEHIGRSYIDNTLNPYYHGGPGGYWRSADSQSLRWVYNTTLYSISNSGVLSTVATNIFNAGTLSSGTYAGQSFSTSSFLTARWADVPAVIANRTGFFVDNGDGTATCVRPIRVGSVDRIGVFIYNSSGSVIKSFAGPSYGNGTTVINHMTVVRKIGPTKFSVFTIGSYSGASSCIVCTFDTSDSTFNVVHGWGTYVQSISNQNVLDPATCFSGKYSLEIYFKTGYDTTAYYFSFVCSDHGVPTSDPVRKGSITISGYCNTYKLYDTTYKDHWFAAATYTSAITDVREPIFSAGQNANTAMSHYKVDSVALTDLNGQSERVSCLVPKGFLAYVDDNGSSFGTPYQFVGLVHRLSENEFVAFVQDESAGPSTRGYMQIYKSVE